MTLPSGVEERLNGLAHNIWSLDPECPAPEDWVEATVKNMRAAAELALEAMTGPNHPLANVFKCEGKHCQAVWIKRPIGRDDINCAEAREHGWELDTTNGVKWWCPNCKGEPEGRTHTLEGMQAEIDHYHYLYVESAADQVELAKKLDKAEAELAKAKSLEAERAYRPKVGPTTMEEADAVYEAWRASYLDSRSDWTTGRKALAAAIDTLRAKSYLAGMNAQRSEACQECQHESARLKERYEAELFSLTQRLEQATKERDTLIEDQSKGHWYSQGVINILEKSHAAELAAEREKHADEVERRVQLERDNWSNYRQAEEKRIHAAVVEAVAGETEPLLKALVGLYEHTADYIRCNHLGDVHHNQVMQQARDAILARLSAPEKTEASCVHLSTDFNGRCFDCGTETRTQAHDPPPETNGPCLAFCYETTWNMGIMLSVKRG